MRLPTPWMVAAFPSGIGLPNQAPISSRVWLGAIALAIPLAAVLLARNRPAARWACALALWFATGGLALRIKLSTVPANHVTRLIERYARAGIRPFRADEHGAVTAVTDVGTLSVHPVAESCSRGFRA